mmetsp:Transcript_20370/g.50290  ORF Transcript_20370/g.50290 Transcript_20370/m.50290 type:complete len:125 (-) Transcript_20370:8-382(-)
MADAGPMPGEDDEMDAARQAELEAEQVLMRKYGGLPKANPIFAHSLKSQKHYFDSGDWQLQQQGGLGTAGLPDYEGDLSQRPLAYDHHAQTAQDGEKGTTQPPRIQRPAAVDGADPMAGASTSG